MTTEQRNLILQAIGALKAALGTAPELPFTEPVKMTVDLSGLKHKTRELAAKLFSIYGTRRIDWHDRELRRLIFEAGFNNSDNFIWTLEKRGIVRINRAPGVRKLIASIEFLKAVEG